MWSFHAQISEDISHWEKEIARGRACETLVWGYRGVTSTPKGQMRRLKGSAASDAFGQIRHDGSHPEGAEIAGD